MRPRLASAGFQLAGVETNGHQQDLSRGDADLIRGNRTRLLVDGPATFEAMKAAIAQARGRILLESYIVEDGGVAAEVAELLLIKAAEGVKVSLIGPIRARFDYRVFKLRGEPIHIPNAEHRQLHLTIFGRLNNPFVHGLLIACWDAYDASELTRFQSYQYWTDVWSYHEQIVDALCADDFERVGTMIGALGLPTLVVQEGGYRTRTLGTNARRFFQGLRAGAREARAKPR